MSGGSSEPAIYSMVQRAIEGRQISGGSLIDVGCGTGGLWPYLEPRFSSYTGVDVVEYEGFPTDQRFVALDLDAGRVPLPNESGDLVVAVETIEHLEKLLLLFN